jgi:hypothetical protein
LRWLGSLGWRSSTATACCSLGGALAYYSTGSTSSATSAASNVASLNGIAGSGASPSVVTSPTADGNQAVQVSVTTNAPLLLARLLTTSTSVPVSATAMAEIQANAPACIVAINGGGSGISLSGTGSVTADSCAVASKSTICADGGANPSDVITTKYLYYGSGTNPTSSSCTLSAPSGSSLHVSKSSTGANDPLAGNSEVSTATSHLGLNSSGSCAGTSGTVCNLSSPSVTTGTAVDVTFDSNGKKSTTATSLTTDGCTGTYSSSTWTVTCGSNATLGMITVSGGITVNFTSTGVTYNFASSTNTCSGTSNVSICNTGTSLNFAGPATFVLSGSVYNGGGASMALGTGSSSNSYNIGKDGSGYSINAGTSQLMTFGDATGSGDLFETAGTITSGGGSCLALPAAAEHDINGSINTAGGIVLGAGIYTVDGYVAFGASGGGDVSNCPTSGTTTGVTALGVTLVLGGASTVSCGGTTSAFCAGSGYNTIKLTAPTSSSTEGSSTAQLAVIGPQTSTITAGATFTSGASNTQVSGAFYFPNGPIDMSGSATLHDTVDSGACLELIGSQVTASAGTAAGSTCSGLGSGSSATNVGLVQ